MKYAESKNFTLYQGDNREILKELDDNSIDSIVTDPPYELGFMGKSWDASGIAYDVSMWQEALRVLKPGGHLLAFSGSRTYHRMAVAIEDAGFEIRDQIMWIYGSGFPKSLDVSKAIDKAAGAEREVIGTETKARSTSGDSALPTVGGETVYKTWNITTASTDAAKQWQGWGTALKPAHEPVVVARKPLIGTVAENVLTYGTGGLNIDASRVSSDDNFDGIVGRPIQKLATRRDGETNEEYRERVLQSPAQQAALAKLKELGRWPANVIHDGSDEVVELFPESKGGAFPAKRGNAVNTSFASGQETEGGFRAMGDSGSAARFFYCAKASKRDRNEGVDERVNNHPTVKPTDLMRYLCRLVTQPGGTVLDPFTGSGSTGKAAIYEGFKFIGIEMTEEYLPIAKGRIEFAEKEQNANLPIYL